MEQLYMLLYEDSVGARTVLDGEKRMPCRNTRNLDIVQISENTNQAQHNFFFRAERVWQNPGSWVALISSRTTQGSWY